MVIPDIIDNSNVKVFEILNHLHSTHKYADFASGYFNLGGYALVKDTIDNLNRFRLLLGREPSVTSEPTRTGNPIKILNKEFKTDLEKDLNSETKAIVDKLIDFLKRDQVEVRLYTKGFFHGKAYIFDDIAIVGSSNFTAAGLTANTELNSVHKQIWACDALRKWFNKFWNDSEDFKDQLIEILDASKFGNKEYTPYQIYLKTLYEYFKEDLETGTEELTRASAVELTEFQEEGYQKALKILEKYNGVMVADSVGLGKTFIGKKLLEHYAYYRREKALLICPAQLKEMWSRELFNANIQADIKSQEEISQKDFPVEEYKDLDLILIDESQNFRNKNQRYNNLSRIIGSGKRKKVILITATPINNSIFDLYHQTALITKGDDTYFRGIGINNLRDYFKNAENAENGLFNLLEEIVIRRTRQYIKKNYQNVMINGKKIKFPERCLNTVHYNLESTYSNLYENIASKIENLSLVCYNIEEYKNDKSKDDIAKDKKNQALIGLIKTLFLKRLESSIEAFKISIERQLDFQKK
ncbi:MAG: phospholipase D-like domain-containing protein, partial [Methanosarcinales archaeon]